MSNVLNRTTRKLLTSVNTPDYSPAEWIIRPDLSAVKGVDPKFWVIEGDAVRVMTDAEKITNVLPLSKMEKLTRFDVEINQFIAGHYDDGSQKTLTVLLVEAVATGLYNRAGYIQRALNWVKSCIGYFYGRGAAVKAATTFEQLDAVSWDLSPLGEVDPLVTIQKTMGIPD